MAEDDDAEGRPSEGGSERLIAQAARPGQSRIDAVERPVEGAAADAASIDRSLSLIHRGDVADAAMVASPSPEPAGAALPTATEDIRSAGAAESAAPGPHAAPSPDAGLGVVHTGAMADAPVTAPVFSALAASGLPEIPAAVANPRAAFQGSDAGDQSGLSRGAATLPVDTTQIPYQGQNPADDAPPTDNAPTTDEAPPTADAPTTDGTLADGSEPALDGGSAEDETPTPEDGSGTEQDAPLDDDFLPPLADAPGLSVSPAAGAEDGTLSLDITAALVDPAAGESLSVTISGLPAGASLSAGILSGVAADGSSIWTLGADDLPGLVLTPPADFTGAFELDVVAVSTVDGSVASAASTVQVTVAPAEVAIPAATDIVEIGDLVANEDAAIPLDLLGAFDAATGLSDVQSVVISGLPAGATLSAGALQADGAWLAQAADLQGLILTPVQDSDEDFRVGVEFRLSGSEVVNAAFDVRMDAVADVPTITIAGASSPDVSIIPFSIGGGSTDIDGSESVQHFVSGMPDGARLSAGTYAGDGLWSLTAEEMIGLSLRPPTDFFGSFQLTTTALATEASNGDSAVWNRTVTATVSGGGASGLWHDHDARGDEDTAIDIGAFVLLFGLAGLASIKISGVPDGGTLSGGTMDANGAWLISISLLSNLTSTSPENDASDVTRSVVAKVLFVPLVIGRIEIGVDAVADAPSLTVQVADGIEDQPLALDIGGALIDTDGSETQSFAVAGLPEGAMLSAGVRDPLTGIWILKLGDLPGLELTPPKDYSGTLTFDVRAITLELEGDSTVTTQTVSIEIAAATDVFAIATPAAEGVEDGAIALRIDVSSGDTDGSESVVGMQISGVPDGATLSAGVDLGGGLHVLDAADLTGLTITPPADFSGDFTLQVAVTLQDGGADPLTLSADLPVHVAPVADAPVLSAINALGLTGTPLDLDISVAAASAADGNEPLSITLSGIPAGGILSAGLNNGDGTWTLAAGALDGLQLSLPDGWSGQFEVGVEAFAFEPDSGGIARSATTFEVRILLDAPHVALSAHSSGDAGDAPAPQGDGAGSEAFNIFVEEGGTAAAPLVSSAAPRTGGDDAFDLLAEAPDQEPDARETIGTGDPLPEGAVIFPDFVIDGAQDVSRVTVTLDSHQLLPDDLIALEGEAQGVSASFDLLSGAFTLEGAAPASAYRELVRALRLDPSAEQGARSGSIEVYDAAGAEMPLASQTLSLVPGQRGGDDGSGLAAHDASFDAAVDDAGISWDWSFEFADDESFGEPGANHAAAA